MKKRIAVGFFIHQLEDDYASLLMKGAVAAAEDLNINLVIFPGKVINGEYYDQEHTAFDYQYNVIYDFASEKSLDGVVVSAGTIGTFVSDEYMENFIRKFNLPLITVERKIGAYPCLRFNADGIKDIVNHLVSVHGCRRIAFVSGPEGNGDAEQRLAAYKSALADNGIEVDDKLIAHGNFSEYSVEVVDDMLDKCGIIPDAICMANDTMCVGAYKALRNRGLEPGKDILVTGYDDSPIALALNPMLTTVRASADILGYMAVTDIYNRISHIDAEEPSMKSSMILRGSCGCSEDSMISGEELVKISSDITLSETAELFVSRFIPLKPGNKRAGLCREIAEIIYRIFVYCEENAGKETEAMIVGKLDKLLRSGCSKNLRMMNLSE